MKQKIDVRLHRLGTVVTVHPLTAKAKTWMARKVDAPTWAWQGGALAVEPRMADAIVEGLTAAGLTVAAGETPRRAAKGR